MSGAILPGAGLNEVALAAELNVSRTPVREAIRQLAAEGFADYKPHCGGSVLRPSSELVRESRAPEWAESVARAHVRITYLDLAGSLGAAAS